MVAVGFLYRWFMKNRKKVLLARVISMKKIFAVGLLATLLLCNISGIAYSESNDYLALFQTEQSAQQHCPSDTVVWLNLPTGIYHFKGQRWYGNTKHGAYVCQKEADQADDRVTRNGQ